MTEPTPSTGDRDMSLTYPVPSDGPLGDRIAALIEQTRLAVAIRVNAGLTLMNWRIGRMIDVEVLREGRAGYAQEIVASLEPQLSWTHIKRYCRCLRPKLASSTSNRPPMRG